MFGKFIHKIIHLLGWQKGHTVSWWESIDYLYVGFKCSTCGKISGVELSNIPNLSEIEVTQATLKEELKHK